METVTAKRSFGFDGIDVYWKFANTKPYAEERNSWSAAKHQASE